MRVICFSLFLLWSLSLQAGGTGEPLTYDRIELAATASREVDNDLLVAVVYAQREGGDAAKLAAQVSESVRWGVETAKQVPGVKVQTLSYQTIPVYAKQTITGWRVSQAFRLESQDAAALGDLLGRLQQRLALQSIDYEVSPASREAAENDLIVSAIAAFRKRAELVTAELGRSDYRLVRMAVDTSDVGPRPMRARSMALAAEVAPALEAGTQTVQVGIRGTIELQIP